MTSSIGDIEKLVELFKINQNENQLEDDEDDEKPQENTVQCSSNEPKPTKRVSTKNKQSPYAKIEQPKKKEVMDPEADDTDGFFFDETTNGSCSNWKKVPQWDISYKQSVTASDVFLGMGFKNPSTSSCENMVIAIDLPGENRQNIDLKIEKENLTLNSPKFLLDLKLPHAVDPKKGNAQFDKEGEKLIVTLVMKREFDFVNF